MTGWLDGSPVSTPLSKITLGFLEDMGYTVNYNLADVYIMSWPSTTDANNLEQTYIKGFLDVSGGNIINRKGNLSVLDGTMDVSGDVTFDSKLSVGGDVSLCSTGGVNARVDICGNLYAQYDTENPSIPAGAIIGLGNVTPNFTGPVKFEDKVGINTTVIPDANSAALDVSGNINFTGILKKDGVEYVSGATNLDGLSDVIVGGANFANSLLIGSSTTGELYVANNNTGVGTGVFTNLTSGDGNVGMGYMSLNKVSTGSSNIGIGLGAARLVNIGQHNVAIGDYAGDTITTGGYNTFIGSGADADTGLIDLNNSTAIGYNAKVTASNQIMLGTVSESVVAPGNMDICGNLYAHYPDESIPAGAIIGGVGGGNNFTTDVSMNANLAVFEHITVNPIDVAVEVKGIQALDEYVKFTIPYSMTALKYFCTSHSTMIGDFILADSTTETDKTYYVRMVATDPQNTAPYYLFSDTPNGTTLNGGALNDEALTINGGIQLTLYKGNTYTFISTNTVGHPFIVGDSWKVTTGMKLESTGDGAVTASTYTNPYPLHVNGMANIENNLNVARTLTVAGPIRQW